MTRMIPVSFPNREGLKLFGILHEPTENKHPDKAVIILSPGIKSRVAPHRLYIKMSRKLAEIGFFVLRYDFYGLGDSEGEIKENFTANLYGSIQIGKFIHDTISAMNWLEDKFKIRKFILAGLCGGAITGLHSGQSDSRVIGLFGLGMPVILDSTNIDKYKYVSKGQLNRIRLNYIYKIFSLNSWLRFFSFRTNYQLLFKSFFKTINIKNKIFSFKVKDSENKTIKKIDGNFNPFFSEIFRRFASSRRVCLVFSGADRLYWEFQEKYLKVFNNEFEKFNKNVNIKTIEGANHIFSFKIWQDEMLTILNDWILDFNKEL